ncbi:hypothetical protein BaRGS_00030210 [Batillaria attramentaria]|uniref:Uncharacterized protein n=1 Tax=Batillaria attramentaria TaxID=370345 RepID=A0ABD0JUK5_9CAEN
MVTVRHPSTSAPASSGISPEHVSASVLASCAPAPATPTLPSHDTGSFAAIRECVAAAIVPSVRAAASDHFPIHAPHTTSRQQSFHYTSAQLLSMTRDVDLIVQTLDISPDSLP